MSAIRTRLWSAQDGLLTRLLAESWPNDVTPVLGIPGRLERDSVWISGEVDSWNAEHRVSGLTARDETFELRIHVLATRLGGDYATIRSAIQTYAALVENALYADPTLGGSVMLATVRAQQLEESMVDERRRSGLLTYFVTCEAYAPASN